MRKECIHRMNTRFFTSALRLLVLIVYGFIRKQTWRCSVAFSTQKNHSKEQYNGCKAWGRNRVVPWSQQGRWHKLSSNAKPFLSFKKKNSFSASSYFLLANGIMCYFLLNYNSIRLNHNNQSKIFPSHSISCPAITVVQTYRLQLI